MSTAPPADVRAVTDPMAGYLETHPEECEKFEEAGIISS